MRPIHLVYAATAFLAAGLGATLESQTTSSQPQSAPSTTSTRPVPATSTSPAAPTATRSATLPAPRGRSAPAPLPQSQTAAITGKITDASGKGLANAIVTFSSRTAPPAPGGNPSTITAPDGTFTLQNFPAGPAHSTLTVMSGGQVVGTIELDTNMTAGTTTRLDQDIRVNGPTAVPIKQ
ncbi:MAG TPA: hypothetical protein VHM90_15760 [Phycisphaerae bacterium]|nr:hypothetical protein [Phycisphaerae bacterium]